MRTLSILVVASGLAGFLMSASEAGEELVASKSLTVQPNGPRPGESGSKYFNIHGKDNDQYASFGVLVVDLPKDIQEKTFKKLTLTFVQSIPKFAKDGAIRFFLAPDLDASKELKFDAKVADGVGDQIKPLHPLGSGTFKNDETGKTESFSLTVDDSARAQIARGGKLYVVIVPADPAVAATYFGANEAGKEKSPKLTLELP
jgi:hypothetical protein